MSAVLPYNMWSLHTIGNGRRGTEGAGRGRAGSYDRNPYAGTSVRVEVSAALFYVLGRVHFITSI